MKFEMRALGRVYLPMHFKLHDKVSMSKLYFKVDTGADFTTISKVELVRMGYTHDWIMRNAVTGDDHNVTTATGDVHPVGIVQLPLVNFLEYEAINWPFRVLLGENRDFRNLLGRDLMAGFDYTFRNSTNAFEISRIGRFTPIHKFLPNQRVHEVN